MRQDVKEKLSWFLFGLATATVIVSVSLAGWSLFFSVYTR